MTACPVPVVEPVSCIILAGGASRRMGSDKRRLRLWGEHGPTLLEHAVARAARFSDDLIVALNDPGDWDGLAARLVVDEGVQAGPLAGLAAGLAVCRYEYALTLACDLPLLQDGLLAALLAYPRPYDALAPIRPEQTDGPRNALAVEPLIAIYRRSCLSTIRACLARHARALVAPLTLVDMHCLPPDVWRRYDPKGLSFVNVNCPVDLDRVAALSGTEG